MMDLSPQHLALLRTASTRSDGLLPRPDRLVGVVLRRMADRLLAAGVVEAAPIDTGQPQWFKQEDGDLVGLRVTQTGRALVSGSLDSENHASEHLETSSVEPSAFLKPAKTHRLGTKRALLIEMIGGEGGATLDALADATGWQPHTVRAALTRLRQDGVAVERVTDAAGASAYRSRGDASSHVQRDAGAAT